MKKPEGRHLHIEINEDTGVVRWQYEQVVRTQVLKVGTKAISQALVSAWGPKHEVRLPLGRMVEWRDEQVG